jgi:hypothetical protein
MNPRTTLRFRHLIRTRLTAVFYLMAETTIDDLEFNNYGVSQVTALH